MPARMIPAVAMIAVLSGCTTPVRTESGMMTPPGSVPVAPAPATGAGRQILADGRGGYVLPDGSTVMADAGGGFTLPNGQRVIPDGAGGITLPNGSHCLSNGAGGYRCP